MSESIDRAMAFSTKEHLRRCFNISETTEEALLVMHTEIESLRTQLAAAEAERDVARMAARWLLPFTINTPHTQAAIGMWPWLDEEATSDGT